MSLKMTLGGRKKPPRLIDQLRVGVADPMNHLCAHGLYSRDGVLTLARNLKPALNRAVAFRLTDDIVEAACRLALDHPDVLAEMSRRARLPYDVCFFEWSNWKKLEICKSPRQASTPQYVGALCVREKDEPQFSFTTVSPSAESGDETIGLSPYSTVFDPDKEWGMHGGFAHAWIREYWEGQMAFVRREMPESVDEPDYDHVALNMWMFANAPWNGKEYHEAQLQWDAVRDISRRTLIRLSRFEEYTINRALGDHTMVQFRVASYLPSPGLKQEPRDAATGWDLQIAFKEELGDPKIILAIVSLLSSGTRIVDWDAWDDVEGSTYAGGRIVKYMKQRVVRLKLPLKMVARQTRAIAYKIKKRRHEVMGHWCSSHRSGDPACSHVYEDDSPREKHCGICGHKIWYRHEHVRGDASVGFVRHDYELAHR